MSAERAAAQIISACRRGLPSLTIPFMARGALLGHALFPNIAGNIMKVINTVVLPSPVGPDGDKARSGRELSE